MPGVVSEPRPTRGHQPPAVVLDGSMAVAFLLPDEMSEQAPVAFAWIAGGTAAHVPAHWALEVANAILTAERRGRLSPAATTECTGLMEAIPVRTDAETTGRLREVGALARRHRLTIYDAAYLELALRLRLPLATLDRPLAAAARAEGLPVAD